MATYLYRLGGWAFDNRRKVLLGWLAVLALVIAAAGAFAGQFSSKFEVPGTESQRAQDLLHEKYPGAGGASARVVFAVPEGERLTDPANRAAVMESVARASKADGVSFAIDPYRAKAISKDGRIGYADVIYPMPADEVDDAARDELEASAEPAKAAGVEVEFGGGLVTDESEAGSEGAGIMIGFLVLAITLGSLVAAGLPLLTAILGVSIAVGGVTALTGAFELTETAPTLATMLGLAVGIDYALFILSRHRQNIGQGLRPREAAAQATGTAGSAVVFAGATVVIALVGLLVVNIPFLTVMGLAAAGAVVIAPGDRPEIVLGVLTAHASTEFPQIAGIVLNGGFPPSTEGNPRPYGMPPFSQDLNDQEVAAVVTYIRQSWGNHASAVSAAEVGSSRGVPVD